MFGIVRKKNADKKSVYTLLVNSSYSFLKFEDEEMQSAIYENKYTGTLIRFHVSDGTFEPVATI